jgi:alanyl-tRNA synthetase
MKAQQIRETYRDYFVRQNHKALPSDSLIPKSDPTLLFTSAGMVQFKDYFLGKMGDALKRATTCQKCFRTTDIDSVGYTARHHTFFEMLGNFSFGDYFKQEAILWCWELLTEEFRLPKDKLWVSVFRDDDEAADIWEKEVGVARERILRFGEDENFWTMGETGPCGPCSEVYYDMGSEPVDDPVALIEGGADRLLEIWNLVFTQFDRQADGSLAPLPRKNVDTGMGLERTAAVLQGAASNYETDLFMPIIRHVEGLSGKKYGQSEEINTAMKVLGDHGRAALFTMTDQITPSNEGRGYVLRRIMRRAIRFARRLGIEEKFFPGVMEVVAQTMGQEYPEVKESLGFARKIAASEEESFQATLERGMTLLGELIKKAKAEGRARIDGKEVFRLYDTYGFPREMTREILKEEGFDYSEKEYSTEMQRQREQSQKAWKGSGEESALHFEQIDRLEPTEFIGYESLEAGARVLAAMEPEGEGPAVVVLDRTPFYGESGGQIGDRGVIRDMDKEVVFRVDDTKKSPAGVVMHLGKFESGRFNEGDPVVVRVSPEHRNPTIRNHTATHLLHAALRKILGDHVKQAGSKVAPEELRFDFTHFEALTAEQLEQIERLVNGWTSEGYPVDWEITSLEEAKKQGAMALFGEKYGQEVRVVKVPGVSLELCGGTHVSNTREIGLFRIIEESSIASGIRRIVALTGAAAVEYTLNRDRQLTLAASILRVSPESVAERVEKLQEENRSLQKALQELKKKQAAEQAGDLTSRVQQVGDVPVLAAKVEVDGVPGLRTAMDELRTQLPPAVICLGAEAGGKAHFICSVDDRWTDKVHAGKIIQAVTQAVDGRGGGKADRAQGGAPDPSRIEKGLEQVLETVKSLIQ